MRVQDEECEMKGTGFSPYIGQTTEWGFIDSCINNVLFKAQGKRTIAEEGAQQLFLAL